MSAPTIFGLPSPHSPRAPRSTASEAFHAPELCSLSCDRAQALAAEKAGDGAKADPATAAAVSLIVANMCLTVLDGFASRKLSKLGQSVSGVAETVFYAATHSVVEALKEGAEDLRAVSKAMKEFLLQVVEDGHVAKLDVKDKVDNMDALHENAKVDHAADRAADRVFSHLRPKVDDGDDVAITKFGAAKMLLDDIGRSAVDSFDFTVGVYSGAIIEALGASAATAGLASTVAMYTGAVYAIITGVYDLVLGVHTVNGAFKRYKDMKQHSKYVVEQIIHDATFSGCEVLGSLSYAATLIAKGVKKYATDLHADYASHPKLQAVLDALKAYHAHIDGHFDRFTMPEDKKREARVKIEESRMKDEAKSASITALAVTDMFGTSCSTLRPRGGEFDAPTPEPDGSSEVADNFGITGMFTFRDGDHSDRGGSLGRVVETWLSSKKRHWVELRQDTIDNNYKQDDLHIAVTRDLSEVQTDGNYTRVGKRVNVHSGLFSNIFIYKSELGRTDVGTENMDSSAHSRVYQDLLRDNATLWNVPHLKETFQNGKSDIHGALLPTFHDRSTGTYWILQRGGASVTQVRLQREKPDKPGRWYPSHAPVFAAETITKKAATLASSNPYMWMRKANKVVTAEVQHATEPTLHPLHQSYDACAVRDVFAAPKPKEESGAEEPAAEAPAANALQPQQQQ